MLSLLIEKTLSALNNNNVYLLAQSIHFHNVTTPAQNMNFTSYKDNTWCTLLVNVNDNNTS